jgi:hypothetical protein
MEYAARRQVASPADHVWGALLQVGSWPDWGTGVTKVEGAAVDGGRLKVYSDVSPGRAFPVRVSIDDDRRVMTWTGGMPLGLFRGVRTFRVSPDGAGSELDVHEKFTGPLLPLVAKGMPDLQPSFDTFADGVKAHCEGRS